MNPVQQAGHAIEKTFLDWNSEDWRKIVQNTLMIGRKPGVAATATSPAIPTVKGTPLFGIKAIQEVAENPEEAKKVFGRFGGAFRNTNYILGTVAALGNPVPLIAFNSYVGVKSIYSARREFIRKKWIDRASRGVPNNFFHMLGLEREDARHIFRGGGTLAAKAGLGILGIVPGIGVKAVGGFLDMMRGKGLAESMGKFSEARKGDIDAAVKAVPELGIVKGLQEGIHKFTNILPQPVFANPAKPKAA